MGIYDRFVSDGTLTQDEADAYSAARELARSRGVAMCDGYSEPDAAVAYAAGMMEAALSVIDGVYGFEGGQAFLSSMWEGRLGAVIQSQLATKQ